MVSKVEVGWGIYIGEGTEGERGKIITVMVMLIRRRTHKRPYINPK